MQFRLLSGEFRLESAGLLASLPIGLDSEMGLLWPS